jgi:superfamily II DNA helicase RecQ
VRLTEAGLEPRSAARAELLISDGIVEEFGGGAPAKKAKGAAGKSLAGKAEKKTDAGPVQLSAKGEDLAARLRAWRAVEAKRLGVPAFMVLHERTVTALAQARPENPRQLLEVDGMGPAKVEKFGAAILGLCGAD